jgi:hypothetical protein
MKGARVSKIEIEDIFDDESSNKINVVFEFSEKETGGSGDSSVTLREGEDSISIYEGSWNVMKKEIDIFFESELYRKAKEREKNEN